MVDGGGLSWSWSVPPHAGPWAGRAGGRGRLGQAAAWGPLIMPGDGGARWGLGVLAVAGLPLIARGAGTDGQGPVPPPSCQPQSRCPPTALSWPLSLLSYRDNPKSMDCGGAGRVPWPAHSHWLSRQLHPCSSPQTPTPWAPSSHGQGGNRGPEPSGRVTFLLPAGWGSRVLASATWSQSRGCSQAEQTPVPASPLQQFCDPGTVLDLSFCAPVSDERISHIASS